MIKLKTVCSFTARHPRFVFLYELNNVIKYSQTQPFIKYFMKLQFSATCFGFSEPSSGGTWEGVYTGSPRRKCQYSGRS